MTTDSIEARAARIVAAREHWHDPEHPEFGELANWMESTEDGWFQLNCAEDSQASIATYGAFSTLGDGSRLIRCTDLHGDATVPVLDALAVAWEALGEHPSWTARNSIRFAYADIQRRLEKLNA